MLNEILDQTILFIFSFLATFLASVSGGGSGFIQFPLLLLMGLPFATALGTHKLAITFLGIGSIAKQKIKIKLLDKVAALLLLIVGVPSVILGSVIVLIIPELYAKVILAMVIFIFGVFALVKKDFGTQYKRYKSKKGIFAAAVFLFIIGLFSGSLSTGSGIFVTLVLVTLLGMDLKSAIMHTMIFISTIWNAIGAITVGMLTSIYWPYMPVLIISSFLGAFFGTSLLIYLPVKIIRIIFSSMSIFCSFALIYTIF